MSGRNQLLVEGRTKRLCTSVEMKEFMAAIFVDILVGFTLGL